MSSRQREQRSAWSAGSRSRFPSCHYVKAPAAALRPLPTRREFLISRLVAAALANFSDALHICRRAWCDSSRRPSPLRLVLQSMKSMPNTKPPPALPKLAQSMFETLDIEEDIVFHMVADGKQDGDQREEWRSR